MTENSVLCGELRALRCPGFLSTRSSCSTSSTSPTSLSQDYENVIVCPATIRCDSMSEHAQGDLLQTQSQDDEQAWRNPLPLELPQGKMWQEKNSHSLPERPKFRNAGESELLGLYARDAQVKPYFEQQNLGELITAEHEVFIETWESGNNHRYGIVGQLWQLNDPWWNSWLEVKFFALLLQSTNQQSKLVETTKTNRSK